MSNYSFSSLARSLASSIASKAGGLIGDEVMKLVWPEDGLPDYFDRVFDQMRKITREELQAEKLNEVQSVIDGTLRWLRDDYLSHKKDGILVESARNRMLNKLDRRADEVYAQVATLRGERHQVNGFPAFLVGASLHLALKQELFLQTGRAVDDALAIRRRAGTVREHAETVWNRIKTQREAWISRQEDTHTRHAGGAGGAGSVSRTSYSVRDRYFTERGANSDIVLANLETRGDGDRWLGIYKNFVLLKTEADVGYPDFICNSWRLIQESEDPVAGATGRKLPDAYDDLSKSSPVYLHAGKKYPRYAHVISLARSIPGWTLRGPAGFAAFKEQVPGTVPVWGFARSKEWWSFSTGTHFDKWTRNTKPSFYAYRTQVEGTVPIYEYLATGTSTDTKDWYYYTAFPGGEDRWRSSWKRRDPVFYAFPSPSPLWAG